MPVSAQRLFGVTEFRVTLDTYAPFLPVMEDELVAAMEDVLAPESPEDKPLLPRTESPAA
jgi:hypothetical protein